MDGHLIVVSIFKYNIIMLQLKIFNLKQREVKSIKKFLPSKGKVEIIKLIQKL